MAVVEIDSVERARELVGEPLGPSEWRTVTQEDIDAFARVSGDDQWIHVDVERARSESPYGGTIAHGNLTLSLIDGMRKDLVASTGFAVGINYGWNRVRFPAPVPAGGRIRLTVELAGFEEVGGGWYEQRTGYTVEVEGSEKPCCVAEHVARVLPGD